MSRFFIQYTDKQPPRGLVYSDFFSTLPDDLEFETVAEATKWVEDHYLGPIESFDLDVEVCLNYHWDPSYRELKVLQ